MQVLAPAVLLAILPLIASCTVPREITKTARSSIEQLLLSEALNRSLLAVSLPVSTEEPLYMEVTGLQLGYLSARWRSAGTTRWWAISRRSSHCPRSLHPEKPIPRRLRRAAISLPLLICVL